MAELPNLDPRQTKRLNSIVDGVKRRDGENISPYHAFVAYEEENNTGPVLEDSLPHNFRHRDEAERAENGEILPGSKI